MNALEIKGLNKSYKDFSLKDVDITLPMGCVMGFIGENGAGKSTTINLILNLIHKDSGSIKVLGYDNQKDEKIWKEEIGVVLDEACFPEMLNAKDVDKTMKHIYKKWSKEKYFSFLKKFRIPDDKQFKDYSRGMKMKLSLAVALSHEAKFLILDEATSGLDPVTRDELLDLFYEFIQDEQHAIFISSHITSDLEKICDYVTFIHKGSIVFSEEKDYLLERLGILKCSKEQLDSIDSSAVRGVCVRGFGIEALVEREKVPQNMTIDPVNLDDIIVFLAKEEKR